MLCGKDKCQWLLLGKAEICGHRCMKEFCGIHKMRLRKGPGTRPCLICGIGVKNDFQLCLAHGYIKLKMKQYYKKRCELKQLFDEEFKRIAMIGLNEFVSRANKITQKALNIGNRIN